MKIPTSLIYTVADVLGGYYFSHTKLDTLFGENGFPGEPPAENCVRKCQVWMKRANDECEDKALGMLSGVLEEFMNLEHSEGSTTKPGFDRIKQALAKVGMDYDFDGIVPVVPSVTKSEPIAAPAPGISGGYSGSNRRFRVALSFPGERRLFIAQIAATLAAAHGKARILYDQFLEAEFARPDLDVYLPNLYRTNSDLICIFLCTDYAQKRFCNLEWRFIRQLIATEDQDRIMFLSFDPIAEIPEIGILGGDGYISIGSRTAEQIAALINERLAL